MYSKSLENSMSKILTDQAFLSEMESYFKVNKNSCKSVRK